MQRGEIWWVDLPEPAAAEPGYRRPVVIVQADAFNRSRIQTAVAVALTSNLRLAAAPGNVLLPAKDAGLPRDSVANVSQLVTLDCAFLSAPCGRLPPRLLARIDDGLRLILEL